MELTTTQQDYLKTVYVLSQGNEGAHISEIAEKLGVTKASTCAAMNMLEVKGLICRSAYRPGFSYRSRETRSNDDYAQIYNYSTVFN